MANRLPPSGPSHLRLPPLDERDIHPQRAYADRRKLDADETVPLPKFKFQPLRERPSGATATPKNLPSLADLRQNFMFMRFIHGAPWASGIGNEYGAHANGESLPNPDKWVFSPSGSSIYEGSWRRMTDDGVVLLDLESEVTARTDCFLRYDSEATEARFIGIPANDDFSNPLWGSAALEPFLPYLVLDSRLPDKVDRARHLLSSLPNAREYTGPETRIPFRGSIIRGTVWGFTAAKTIYRMATAEDPVTGIWFFYIWKIVSPQLGGPPGSPFRVQALASGRADAYGMELTFNYDSQTKPRSRMKQDMGTMMLELSLAHYAALCLGHKCFIRS